MDRSILQNIKWLGHDSFLIDAEKTIYIDPFQIQPGKKADLILVTHDHYDHCSPEDIARIQTDETVIITEQNSAQKLEGQVKIMKPGQSATVQGVNIETVISYNTNKDFHPKDNGWLGFIIEINGTRIYHAGDADFIPEMKEVKADIALLPVSGTYVMTAEEAVNAALAINPQIAIPMHYGAIVGSERDAVDFKNALDGKIEVQILEKT